MIVPNYGLCKNCKQPIEDDSAGFCPSEDDRCWKEWCNKLFKYERCACGHHCYLEYLGVWVACFPDGSPMMFGIDHPSAKDYPAPGCCISKEKE